MSVNKMPLVVGMLVVGLSGAGSTFAADATDTDLRARCEAEAAEYGVAPEQLQEYVDGCIMAAGAPAPAAGDATITDDAAAGAEGAEGGKAE